MLVVVMPTRGRPAPARLAVDSFLQTKRLKDTRLVAVLDAGDPTLPDYRAVLHEEIEVFETVGNMIQRTNNAARHLLTGSDGVTAIGWMADDNRFRTPGWDLEAFSWLSSFGFVALNDLFWSERDKAVNVFVRSEIIRSLGWYANPGQQHHYMDDTWRLLGISTDSYLYLPEVICEHMHPVLGKTEWDKEYRDHEAREFYATEDRAFINWIQQRFSEDRAKVKAVL